MDEPVKRWQHLQGCPPAHRLQPAQHRAGRPAVALPPVLAGLIPREQGGAPEERCCPQPPRARGIRAATGCVPSRAGMCRLRRRRRAGAGVRPQRPCGEADRGGRAGRGGQLVGAGEGGDRQVHGALRELPPAPHCGDERLAPSRGGGRPACGADRAGPAAAGPAAAGHGGASPLTPLDGARGTARTRWESRSEAPPAPSRKQLGGVTRVCAGQVNIARILTGAAHPAAAHITLRGWRARPSQGRPSRTPQRHHQARRRVDWPA
jgi:hypothetical protein